MTKLENTSRHFPWSLSLIEDFYLKDKYRKQTALAKREAVSNPFNAVKAVKSKDSAHMMRVNDMRKDPDMRKKLIKEVVKNHTREEDWHKEEKLSLSRKIGRGILKLFGF